MLLSMRKCFDSSVLICLTTEVFSQVLMICNSVQFGDVLCCDCFSVFVKNPDTNLIKLK